MCIMLPFLWKNDISMRLYMNKIFLEKYLKYFALSFHSGLQPRCGYQPCTNDHAENKSHQRWQKGIPFWKYQRHRQDQQEDQLLWFPYKGIKRGPETSVIKPESGAYT